MIACVWRGALGLLVGAAAGVAALILLYSLSPRLTLDMDRNASAVVSGLYDAERAGQDTFAWTGRHATLTLRGLDRRSDWSCSIRLRGGRADESTLPEVVVSVDGVIAGTFPTANEYRDVEVTIPSRHAESGNRSGGTTVTLTSSTAFVPGPTDKRTLGVMVDRWTCAPKTAGFFRPPPGALSAAAIGGAAFGAAFAIAGLSLAAALSGAALLALAQAVPLAWEFGMFTAYPNRALWLSLWTALLLVVAVRGTERALGRPLTDEARLVTVFTFAVLYLKLLVLLHPSKLPVDVIFHAHRLEWVLDGRYYFTQPMPSGVQFPYAIGLYVFAAPWSVLTRDYVLLLRVVVSAAEAAGAVLVYLLVSRVWRDRFAGAIAAILFHFVPRTFEIVGNANMTNAFAQSLALATLSAAVLWPLKRGQWMQAAALTLLTAWALLSHISTFTLLGGILLTLAALYWFRHMRAEAVTVFAALAIAASLSVVIYYAHFGDAYRSAARVSAAAPAGTPASPGGQAPTTTPSPQGAGVSFPSKLVEAGRLTVAAVGWPIFLMALAGGVTYWRRGPADRLSLAILALVITYGVVVAAVVLMPVERSFQRYAAEFISRVTLATYPAMVILAGLGAASAWRGSWPARMAAAALTLAAGYVGVTTWIEWLR